MLNRLHILVPILNHMMWQLMLHLSNGLTSGRFISIIKCLNATSIVTTGGLNAVQENVDHLVLPSV